MKSQKRIHRTQTTPKVPNGACLTPRLNQKRRLATSSSHHSKPARQVRKSHLTRLPNPSTLNPTHSTSTTPTRPFFSRIVAKLKGQSDQPAPAPTPLSNPELFVLGRYKDHAAQDLVAILSTVVPGLQHGYDLHQIELAGFKVGNVVFSDIYGTDQAHLLSPTELYFGALGFVGQHRSGENLLHPSPTVKRLQTKADIDLPFLAHLFAVQPQALRSLPTLTTLKFVAPPTAIPTVRPNLLLEDPTTSTTATTTTTTRPHPTQTPHHPGPSPNSHPGSSTHVQPRRTRPIPSPSSPLSHPPSSSPLSLPAPTHHNDREPMNHFDTWDSLCEVLEATMTAVQFLETSQDPVLSLKDNREVDQILQKVRPDHRRDARRQRISKLYQQQQELAGWAKVREQRLQMGAWTPGDEETYQAKVEDEQLRAELNEVLREEQLALGNDPDMVIPNGDGSDEENAAPRFQPEFDPEKEKVAICLGLLKELGWLVVSKSLFEADGPIGSRRAGDQASEPATPRDGGSAKCKSTLSPPPVASILSTFAYLRPVLPAGDRAIVDNILLSPVAANHMLQLEVLAKSLSLVKFAFYDGVRGVYLDPAIRTPNLSSNAAFHLDLHLSSAVNPVSASSPTMAATSSDSPSPSSTISVAKRAQTLKLAPHQLKNVNAMTFGMASFSVFSAINEAMQAQQYHSNQRLLTLTVPIIQDVEAWSATGVKTDSAAEPTVAVDLAAFDPYSNPPPVKLDDVRNTAKRFTLSGDQVDLFESMMGSRTGSVSDSTSDSIGQTVHQIEQRVANFSQVYHQLQRDFPTLPGDELSVNSANPDDDSRNRQLITALAKLF